MNSRQGPPNPRRHSPADPRMQHFSRAPPFPGRGGPPPMNGRTMNGRGRFDDRGGRGRGGARMQPMGMRDGARTVARPPPPPPPGRGFRGRMPPGRGPMMVRGPPLTMHGHYPRPSPGPARMIPPPPPPPPPPGRGIGGAPRPPPPRSLYPTRPHGALSAHHPSPHVHGSHVQPRPSIQPPQHYVQIPAQPAPVDTSAYSKLQIDQAWTEHAAPNSTTKYYYNAITKESTYTKPDCLVKKVKDMHINETETPKQQLRNQTTWAEYTDASSGKTYYSNGINTTWERPAEMGGDAESEEDEAPKKKKRKKNVENEVTEFNNSAEATAAFKGMLLAKGVQPTTNWNEVVKMCSSDSRWQACEILTLGERKQALAEYQTKRANELRTLERQERMRAKEAFTQLLMEKLVTIEEFSATTSQFADMRNLLASDDRFYAVEKEETRESLFLDFCEEVRKREERKKRSKKREAKDEFLAFLKEREEEGLLTFACTWASFIGTLEESHRNDPRFQASPALPEADRELCFADYVLELQAAEEDRRRRIRDARRRAEKAQKEAYTEALRKMAYEGSLLPSSRWHTVEPLITADPSFAPVQAHDRESPREIFEDFVDEWNIVYRRDRSFLSNLSLSSSKQSLSVHPNMTYDEFSRALLDQAAHSPDLYGETRGILNREDPISSARLYFNELLSQARESQGQAAKRSKSGSRRGTTADSSSEDEGEIREEGEVVVDEEDANMTTAENASDEPE